MSKTAVHTVLQSFVQCCILLPCAVLHSITQKYTVLHSVTQCSVELDWPLPVITQVPTPAGVGCGPFTWYCIILHMHLLVYSTAPAPTPAHAK